MNSEGIKDITLSSNQSINDLMRQQEAILIKLIEKIERPFKNIWEFAEWHRTAVALQLGNYQNNERLIDNRAVYDHLMEGARTSNGILMTPEMRSEIIYAIHNHLEITYSQARLELSKREGKGENLT